MGSNDYIVNWEVNSSNNVYNIKQESNVEL